MIVERNQRCVERGIKIYLILFFSLLALAWLPFLIHGRSTNSFPLSGFSERFGDLVHFANTPQKLAKPGLEDWEHLAGTMFPRNYGPLAILIYLFLLKVCSPYSVVIFLAAVFSALLTGAFLLWNLARRSPGYRPFMALAIFGTVLLALPTAETALRANIEGLLWIGYAAGIGYMFSRKWSKSASVLAIASCIKPYPLFWFVLLLFRKKYKQVVSGLGVLALTFIGGLALLGAGNPARGAHRISGSSTIFFDDYLIGFRDVSEIVEDHSLFQASKSAVRIVNARGFKLPDSEYKLQRHRRVGYILFAVYVPVVGIAVLGILWAVRTKPFLNQIFSLSLCLTLFPLLAGDYTLTILYIPMGLFLLFLLRDVAEGRANLSQGRLMTILVPCAWLMAPQPWFGIWAGDLRAAVLLFLLFVTLNTPMPMAIDRHNDFALPEAA